MNFTFFLDYEQTQPQPYNCKPEYDARFDYTVNERQCLHKCGEKELHDGRHWCYTI